ncbi:MAG TPA: exodeoxyribonuclease VII large subunit [bacterium]
MPKSALPQATDAAAVTGGAPVLTVGQVVQRIRLLIESQFPAAVWIEGQLSNCSFPASGHIYFDLADEEATDRRGQRLLLPCAFFRGANQHLRFRPEDGMKVLCLGEVGTYEAKGQYQLRVVRLEPRGIGALQLAFEQLKRRLEAEGLFEEARKRPIPTLPDRVGIVTSGTGSAIHDMLVRLRGQFHVIVLPVKVQGEGAAEEIAEAVRTANAARLADVLIVGRGGGSLEDLWAFNEEAVARAIAQSAIPVISAVGHEDHWTIADYVADLRASTPTHAAQLLVQRRQDMLEKARELFQRLDDAMRAALEVAERGVESLIQRLRLLHPAAWLEESMGRVERAGERMSASMRHLLAREDASIGGLAGRLEALSPLAVLARGYSITFTLPGRRVVRTSSAVQPGDRLETLLADGRIHSVVDTAAPGAPAELDAAE